MATINCRVGGCSPVLPDSGNCPQIKGIFVVFRDQDCLVRDFFFFFFFFFFF